MKRRKFVVGLGSLAAGTAAAIGTGAFDQAGLRNRNSDIRVTTDQQGFLALRPTGSPDQEKYVSFNGDRLSVDIDGDAAGGGEGVNEDSYYYFKNLFKIVNHGSQEVELNIDGADSGDAGQRLKWVAENLNRGAVSGQTLGVGEKCVVSLELSVKGKEAGDQISDSFTIEASST
jgi:hypothetical protein